MDPLALGHLTQHTLHSLGSMDNWVSVGSHHLSWPEHPLLTSSNASVVTVITMMLESRLDGTWSRSPGGLTATLC